MGRIYDPEQFGELEVLLKISAVFIAIAGFRYEMAIVVENEARKARDLTRLSIFLNSIISSILLILILLFRQQFSHWLGITNHNILFVIPLIVWLSGCAEAIILWRNREKKYRTISVNRIATSASATGYKLSHPFIASIPINGLVLGQVIGQLVALVHIAYKLPFNLFRTTKKRLKEVAQLYKSFPIYSMPSGLLNLLATSMPVFLISYYAGQKATGYFAYAFKLSYLPLGMIALAMGQVLFERLSRMKDDRTETAEISQNLLKLLVGISVIPAIVLFFWGEELMVWAMGSKWKIAGVYVENTILFYIAMFVSNPFFCTFDVYKKLDKELLFNIVFIAASTLSMILAYHYYQSTLIALQWYSLVGILLRIGILHYFFGLVGRHKLTILLLVTAIAGCIYYILQFQ
ncbi:MAG: oligosaccharide flippase family protein [Bacteroidia bacterium]|nr:oligosaccharide flippase family protein [Bacteroidia bacterium]NNJ54676.1 oligosaccharide flippase family protein [Bacteroidia bacterium]